MLYIRVIIVCALCLNISALFAPTARCEGIVEEALEGAPEENMEGGKSFPEAVIVRVQDGKRFILEDEGGRQTSCRLYGVELPRRKQRFGKQARTFLRNLAIGQKVGVEFMDEDGGEGNRAAVLRTDRGDSINQMLVAVGAAWVTPGCGAEACAEWRALMGNARKHRAGIWREKNPVPPWKYTIAR